MGQPKALLPWLTPGVSLGRHVIDTLRDAGVAPLAIVTGAHHDQIAPMFAGTDVAVIFNAGHEAGQLSSLQAGVGWALGCGDSDWVLVTLVDIPAVRVDTVRRLLACTRDTDAMIVRPGIDARHGHPVIWHRTALARLAHANPAEGARGVVRALAAEGLVRDVPVDDQGVLVDIDTPAEYDALRRRTSR